MVYDVYYNTDGGPWLNTGTGCSNRLNGSGITNNSLENGQ
jgi:hypothetical protein